VRFARQLSVVVVTVTAALIMWVALPAFGGDILTVHYKRYAGDYEGWTLWTWDAEAGQNPQEIEAADRDDYGLIFRVVKSDYGDGKSVGLLPKFGDWASKDPPDRIWNTEMDDEVWILSGYPELFTNQPGEDLMGKEVGSVITVHYHRADGDYSGWTLWTWNDMTDQGSREIPASGEDDYGLVFEVQRQHYGDGTQIGLLPKLGNWASKDAPDRIWYPYLGDEVWILGGNDQLFNEVPDTTPWIAGAFVDGRRLVTVSLSGRGSPISSSMSLKS